VCLVNAVDMRFGCAFVSFTDFTHNICNRILVCVGVYIVNTVDMGFGCVHVSLSDYMYDFLDRIVVLLVSVCIVNTVDMERM